MNNCKSRILATFPPPVERGLTRDWIERDWGETQVYNLMQLGAFLETITVQIYPNQSRSKLATPYINYYKLSIPSLFREAKSCVNEITIWTMTRMYNGSLTNQQTRFLKKRCNFGQKGSECNFKKWLFRSVRAIF